MSKMQVLYNDIMRKFTSLVIVVILIFFIITGAKNIYDSYTKIENLNEIRDESKVLKEERSELENELEERKSKDFVEKESRNKLGLSKEGESIYVVEENEPSEEELIKEENKKMAIWQLWREVFFK